MADTNSEKMKSVDLIIPPLRKIKKKLNKKTRAARKTRMMQTILPSSVSDNGVVAVNETTIIQHHPAKTMKRVVFNPEKNQIFEYQCANIKSLDDLDVNFSLEPSTEFKIEEVPDINIADLFNE
jgi:hypothetical protein